VFEAFLFFVPEGVADVVDGFAGLDVALGLGVGFVIFGLICGLVGHNSFKLEAAGALGVLLDGVVG
jgi:hypothetical protein